MSWWGDLLRNYTAAEREQAELAQEAREQEWIRLFQDNGAGLLNSHNEPSPANPEAFVHQNEPPQEPNNPLVAPPLYLSGTMSAGMSAAFSNSNVLLSFAASNSTVATWVSFPSPPTVFDVDYGEMEGPQPAPIPVPDVPRRRFTFADAT